MSKMSFEESSESLDSDELASSLHESGDFSSSTASLALRFPPAWVKTRRSINSALLPLILRPFCFRYIFSCLLVSAFTFFSIVQEISRRVFLSLTLFFFWLFRRGTQGAVHNFYMQPRPRFTGNAPLAKT